MASGPKLILELERAGPSKGRKLGGWGERLSLFLTSDDTRKETDPNLGRRDRERKREKHRRIREGKEKVLARLSKLAPWKNTSESGDLGSSSGFLFFCKILAHFRPW